MLKAVAVSIVGLELLWLRMKGEGGTLARERNECVF